MNFQPIFPKLMRRFTNPECLVDINSYFGNGECDACFHACFPYLFFDYDEIRKNGGSGWYYYNLFHKSVHEFIHLLQFIFICRMNKDLYRKYMISFERFPSMVEAFFVIMVQPSLWKRFQSSMLNLTSQSIEANRSLVSASTR